MRYPGLLPRCRIRAAAALRASALTNSQAAEFALFSDGERNAMLSYLSSPPCSVSLKTVSVTPGETAEYEMAGRLREVGGSVRGMARYERIAAALREDILTGRYPPGARLPGQQEMARTWQTTLPTVRQALEQLQRDGLIRVEHGVGTFVADLDRAYDPFAVASFTEELQKRGLAVETRLLAVEPLLKHAEAEEALGVTAEEGVVALTRLRAIGGRPVVLQHSYAPGRLRSDLADFDGTESLYAFLRHRAGLVAGGYHELLVAESTPVAVADVLDLDAGGPILVSRRTTMTADGRPFLYDEAYLPPERVVVTIMRRGAGTSVLLSPRFAGDVSENKRC